MSVKWTKDEETGVFKTEDGRGEVKPGYTESIDYSWYSGWVDGDCRSSYVSERRAKKEVVSLLYGKKSH